MESIFNSLCRAGELPCRIALQMMTRSWRPLVMVVDSHSVLSYFSFSIGRALLTRDNNLDRIGSIASCSLVQASAKSKCWCWNLPDRNYHINYIQQNVWENCTLQAFKLSFTKSQLVIIKCSCFISTSSVTSIVVIRYTRTSLQSTVLTKSAQVRGFRARCCWLGTTDLPL